MRHGRRLAAAMLAALLMGALAGCANLPFLTPQPAADTVAADPTRAVYELAVDAPEPARALLTRYLDLARFQQVPASESISAAELDRLIVAAPAQVRSLLETQGHFNAEVQVARDAAATGVPLVRVTVQPGPVASVTRVTLEATGALETAAQAGDADALERLVAWRAGWSLPVGAAFNQNAWSSATGGALARLRAEGYPAATWSGTAAQVDAEKNEVRVFNVIDSGPLFRLGELRIEGLQRYDADSVRRLSTFSAGTPFSEQLLLDFQERLQKIGLFEGAVVELDPDPARAGAAPVLVRVKELPLQQATVGVGVSANTGPRVTLEHLHRSPFGSRWLAKNKLEYGSQRQLWEGSLISHPLDGLYRNLVSGNAERLRTNVDSVGTNDVVSTATEVRTSWSARVGRTQDTPRIERLYYGEFAHSRLVTESAGVTSTSNSDAVSANYHWTLRELDNVLLPTQGYTLAWQAAVGHARSSTADNGFFTRGWARLTAYRPLGASWYGTARVEAGQVYAGDSVGLPDTLLFRAGGDESVRGYAYRSLGPTVDGTLASGRVVFSASAEVARPISARLPAFWWAAFVDAGNAAEHWNTMRPALGYGVGLRWRSPVGPLRLDVAHGREVHKTRLHLSVGIAF